ATHLGVLVAAEDLDAPQHDAHGAPYAAHDGLVEATDVGAAGDHHGPGREQVEAARDVPAECVLTVPLTGDAAVDHGVEAGAHPQDPAWTLQGDEAQVGGAEVEGIVGGRLEVVGEIAVDARVPAVDA